jgi:hypothetical protein
VTPFPSFPQIQSADLGEGEWKVCMEREIINSRYEMPLAFHKGMISLWELQSATGEELSALLPYVVKPTRGRCRARQGV